MSNRFYEELDESECYCDLSMKNYTASSQCATCHRNVYYLKDWRKLKRRDLVVHSAAEFYQAEQGDCPYYL